MTTSDSEHQRAKWGRKLDFFMASISSAIGLGNLWRFPYQCYRNGGGAFLIPFLLMVALAGFPLVLSDIAIGQFSQKGPVKCWRAAPIMSGLGWTMFTLNMEVDVYYAVIVSFTFFYTIASMTATLPWDTCNNWWNSPACRDTSSLAKERNCTAYNGTFRLGSCIPPGVTDMIINSTNYTSDLQKPVSSSDEYFHNYVLQISSGITDIGLPRWPVVLCFLATLILIAITLSLNLKTWGKMAYIFTALPYIILTALLVQGFFYHGSVLGVLYFLKPRWSELANPRVWVDAVGQAFFSLGCSGGQQINIASHNRLRGNCLGDAIVITLADTLTSLLCGVVVFSVLGQMAYQLNLPIDEAVDKGAGLAFVVYPTALASMPLAPVWSVFFMLMLFNLGLGSLVAIVAGDQAMIMEELPLRIQERKYIKSFILLFVLLLFFVIGLIYTTNGGMYVLQMMDHNITYVLLLIGIYKAVTIGWIYGADRLFEDMKMMGGWRPGFMMKWVYKIVTPSLIILVLIFNLTDLKPLTYRDYVFPHWSEILGWVIVVATMSIVPIMAICLIATYPEKQLTVTQRIKALCQPTKDWVPQELLSQKAEDTESFLLKNPQSTYSNPR